MIIFIIHIIVSYDQNIPLIFFMWKMDPMPCFDFRLVFTLPPRVHCSTKDVCTSKITFLALHPCIDPYSIWIQSRFDSYRASHIIFQVSTPEYADNPWKTWYFLQENFDISIIHFFDDLLFSNFPISPLNLNYALWTIHPVVPVKPSLKITELS